MASTTLFTNSSSTWCRQAAQSTASQMWSSSHLQAPTSALELEEVVSKTSEATWPLTPHAFSSFTTTADIYGSWNLNIKLLIQEFCVDCIKTAAQSGLAEAEAQLA